jgi:hypothetical protein
MSRETSTNNILTTLSCIRVFWQSFMQYLLLKFKKINVIVVYEYQS